MIEDKNRDAVLSEKTGFERETVYNSIKELAKEHQYLLDKQKLNNLDNLDKIKENDPEFWASKISYYEWNPSKFKIEYFVSPDINLKKLEKDISNKLKEKGIKNKFIFTKYPKEIMDKCSESIRLKTQPIREDENQVVTAMFVLPAEKSDGVEYLKKKLDIDYDEIVMAGNDSNDNSRLIYQKKVLSLFVSAMLLMDLLIKLQHFKILP